MSTLKAILTPNYNNTPKKQPIPSHSLPPFDLPPIPQHQHSNHQLLQSNAIQQHEQQSLNTNTHSTMPFSSQPNQQLQSQQHQQLQNQQYGQSNQQFQYQHQHNQPFDQKSHSFPPQPTPHQSIHQHQQHQLLSTTQSNHMNSNHSINIPIQSNPNLNQNQNQLPQNQHFTTSHNQSQNDQFNTNINSHQQYNNISHNNNNQYETNQPHSNQNQPNTHTLNNSTHQSHHPSQIHPNLSSSSSSPSKATSPSTTSIYPFHEESFQNTLDSFMSAIPLNLNTPIKQQYISTPIKQQQQQQQPFMTPKFQTPIQISPTKSILPSTTIISDSNINPIHDTVHNQNQFNHHSQQSNQQQSNQQLYQQHQQQQDLNSTSFNLNNNSFHHNNSSNSSFIGDIQQTELFYSNNPNNNSFTQSSQPSQPSQQQPHPQHQQPQPHHQSQSHQQQHNQQHNQNNQQQLIPNSNILPTPPDLSQFDLPELEPDLFTLPTIHLNTVKVPKQHVQHTHQHNHINNQFPSLYHPTPSTSQPPTMPLPALPPTQSNNQQYGQKSTITKPIATNTTNQSNYLVTPIKSSPPLRAMLSPSIPFATLNATTSKINSTSTHPNQFIQSQQLPLPPQDNQFHYHSPTQHQPIEQQYQSNQPSQSKPTPLASPISSLPPLPTETTILSSSLEFNTTFNRSTVNNPNPPTTQSTTHPTTQHISSHQIQSPLPPQSPKPSQFTQTNDNNVNTNVVTNVMGSSFSTLNLSQSSFDFSLSPIKSQPHIRYPVTMDNSFEFELPGNDDDDELIQDDKNQELKNNEQNELDDEMNQDELNSQYQHEEQEQYEEQQEQQSFSFATFVPFNQQSSPYQQQLPSTSTQPLTSPVTLTTTTSNQLHSNQFNNNNNNDRTHTEYIRQQLLKTPIKPNLKLTTPTKSTQKSTLPLPTSTQSAQQPPLPLSHNPNNLKSNHMTTPSFIPTQLSIQLPPQPLSPSATQLPTIPTSTTKIIIPTSTSKVIVPARIPSSIPSKRINPSSLIPTSQQQSKLNSINLQPFHNNPISTQHNPNQHNDINQPNLDDTQELLAYQFPSPLFIPPTNNHNNDNEINSHSKITTHINTSTNNFPKNNTTTNSTTTPSTKITTNQSSQHQQHQQHQQHIQQDQFQKQLQSPVSVFSVFYDTNDESPISTSTTHHKSNILSSPYQNIHQQSQLQSQSQSQLQSNQQFHPNDHPQHISYLTHNTSTNNHNIPISPSTNNHNIPISPSKFVNFNSKVNTRIFQPSNSYSSSNEDDIDTLVTQLCSLHVNNSSTTTTIPITSPYHSTIPSNNYTNYTNNGLLNDYYVDTHDEDLRFNLDDDDDDNHDEEHFNNYNNIQQDHELQHNQQRYHYQQQNYHQDQHHNNLQHKKVDNITPNSSPYANLLQRISEIEQQHKHPQHKQQNQQQHYQ